MSKKLIIIIAGSGLISFSAAFVIAWLTQQAPSSPPGQSAQVEQQTELNLPTSEADEISTQTQGFSTTGRAMTEKQLKDLVYDVRLKMQEYDNKLQSLKLREQRLQTAQQTLREDIESLNNLRIELASAVATLKNERDKLEKSRTEIAEAEKRNLVSIAATYDKMDAASAGKILSSMCSGNLQKGTRTDVDNNIDDAVKILYYMTERTKAKLLAELVNSEPSLAALLSQKLKTVAEKQ
jgi:hypothetical protein